MTDEHQLQRINPAGLPDSSRYYSQITVTPPGARLAFFSGQYGANENGEIVSDDPLEQMHQAFQNLRTALEAAGAKPEDVAHITVLMVDQNEAMLGPLEQETEDLWGDRKPASTLIPVPRLAFDAMKFELNAVAVVPNDG